MVELQLITVKQEALTATVIWLEASGKLALLYLLIGHELDGGFGCDLEDVDAVSSPEWPYSPFANHLRETTSDAQGVHTRGVYLQMSERAHSLYVYTN